MGRWNRASLLLKGCVAAMLVFGLIACKKEDRGATLLDPAPGVYKGPPVAELSPQVIAELAKRAKHEEFYNHGGPK
jgi:hypothetical protein